MKFFVTKKKQPARSPRFTQICIIKNTKDRHFSVNLNRALIFSSRINDIYKIK